MLCAYGHRRTDRAGVGPMKVLRCGDVRPTRCPEEFRGVSDLEVLALILEHWSRVHDRQMEGVQPIEGTTSVLVSRMRAAIRDA
jgi:predicted small metal-binding protein